MQPSLTEVKVEGKKTGRNGKVPSGRDTEFVYVNSAYVGSVHDVNEGRRTNNRTCTAVVAPVTEVYREQYWACSRWKHTQKAITGLAITVGVLLGALIGLILFVCLGGEDDHHPVIPPLFSRQHIAAA